MKRLKGPLYTCVCFLKVKLLFYCTLKNKKNINALIYLIFNWKNN